jgi:glycosyltransferase involved in cell wall biosynthesis
MKVLFVSSGNSEDGISPIVKNQGESLRQNGVDLHYFTIKGKGLKGYLRNIKYLKKTIRNIQPDVVHAHYSLTAITASLAGAKPLVVSLMGSDSKSSFQIRILIKFFNKLIWTRLIVKSEDMRKSIGIKNAEILPNGVDIEMFHEREKKKCQEKLGWDDSIKHILFAASPSRIVKNFKLAQQTFELIKSDGIELHSLSNIPHSEMPLWMNAADIVLLTSLWEGSPNVIKEAMACNRPIVSTNVGDVKWLFGNLPGHYLTSFDSSDIADKIEQALTFSQDHNHTTGRRRIIELRLDADSVSKQLVSLYNEILYV